MTAFHHYELLCDAPGCGRTFNAGEATATRTREIAGLDGWVHGVIAREAGGPSKSLDYCSEHAARIRDATPRVFPAKRAER